MLTNRRCFILAASMAGLQPMRALAQPSFPSGLVKIVVPFPPGGGADVLARVLGQQLSDRWGERVIVENRPGAATMIAAGAVAKAPADGLTLLLAAEPTLTINPALYPKMPYDAARDLAPISQLVQMNQILLVRKGHGMTDLKTLIERAKQKPGSLSYASYGSGSEPHLAMEMLKHKAGVSVLHVPYKGVPLALNALLAGEVDMTLSGAASALPHIKSGKLEPIAIGGSKRLPLVSDVPTFTELGFPAVPARAWFGLVAPAGTSPAIVQKIAQDVRQVASSPKFISEQINERGYEPIFSSPDEFASLLERQRKEAVELVKVSGAKPE